ncbi:MAG: LamG-like jellyroll fold domain-containing protein, partial [Bacteroidota bacterium]
MKHSTLAKSIFISLTFAYAFAGYSQNNSLILDGTNDYIETTASIDGPASRTIEWWAKSNGNTNGYMFSMGAEVDNQLFALREGLSNELIFSAFNNDINTGYIVDGNWTHYAVTYDGANLIIYVNGTEIANNNLGTLPTNAAPLFIGRYIDNSGYFNGLIHDFRVWTIEKQVETINAEKNIALQGSETGLLAYYNFNEGSGVVLGDLAGTPETGSLLNGVLNDPPADGLANGPIWTIDVPHSIEVFDQANAANLVVGGTINGGSVLEATPLEFIFDFTNTFSTAIEISNIQLSNANFRVDPLIELPLLLDPATTSSNNSIFFDGAGAGFYSTEVTINSDDPAGAFTFFIDVTVTAGGFMADADFAVSNDGDEGGSDAVFIVSLSSTNTSGADIIFDVTNTGGGTATTPDDFTIPVTQVTIPDGLSSGFINIPIVDDASEEGTETIELQISNPSDPGITILNNTATANILDNDATPPAAPTDLIAFPISDTEVRLEWTDNSTNENGFLVEIAEDYAFTVGVTDVIGTPITNAVFTAGANQEYYYRVIAFNGAEDLTSISAVAYATTEPFPGRAVEFDADGDFIDLGSGPSLSVDGTTDFTVEAWVYLAAGANNGDPRTVVGRYELADPEYALRVSSGTPSIFVRTGAGFATVSSSLNLDEEQWYHLAATYDGTTVRIYVDGTETGSSNSTTGPVSGFSTASTLIGEGTSSTVDNFLGQIDEVKIWNEVISDFGDRFALIDFIDPLNYAGLLGYYSFDDPAGEGVFIDSSPNTNDGLPSGSPTLVSSTIFDVLVTNTNDNGAGSLREAIVFANANPGTTITFDVQEPAPWVINLSTPLDPITADGTIINGASQPGWTFGDENAMIQIDGSGIGTNVNGIDFNNVSNAEVNGLILSGFNGGTFTGAIHADGTTSNLTIGGANQGNIIHANPDNDGIRLRGADQVTIQGNWIGTLDGNNISANGGHGIRTGDTSSDLLIGGAFSLGEGNVIGGHNGINIYGIDLGSGDNISIAGNFIGTNAAGDAAIPN